MLSPSTRRAACISAHSAFPHPQGGAVGNDQDGRRHRHEGLSGDDGPATKAQLWNPQGLAVDGRDNLYIADTYNQRVRKIDSAGTITTIAGNGTAGFSGDGGQAVDAQLNDPVSLALDPAGNVYIADNLNHRVRKVTPDGKITTIAGIGRGFYFGDNGPATKDDMRYPRGLVIGGDGSLYIAEGGGDRIRRVDPAGIITTVAGDGAKGFSGDGGPATRARLNNPFGVSVGADGVVYIAHGNNNRIRKIDAAGVITTVAGWVTNG